MLYSSFHFPNMEINVNFKHRSEKNTIAHKFL